MKNEEFEKYQAYQDDLEDMLNACKNGKTCSYGICDECPLNFSKVDE